jgi:hypothetical protein
VTEVTRIKPQVTKAEVESNTTGRENLVVATDGLCMNNSRPSEGYRTRGLSHHQGYQELWAVKTEDTCK